MNTSSKHMTIVAIMALALCSCRKIEIHDTGGFDWDNYYRMPSIQLPLAADAGADQTITLPLDSTYLDGSRSSPRWLATPPSTFRWTKVSGPTQYLLKSVTRMPLEIAMTTVVASRLVPGVYRFVLTIEQRDAASVTDTVQVTVLDDPGNRNTLTYHNVSWQKAHTAISWQTTFLDPALRPDLWDTTGVHRRNLELSFRPIAQSDWVSVPFKTNTTAPYVWFGFPYKGLIVTQPDNPSLVGTKSDVRIKIL